MLCVARRLTIRRLFQRLFARQGTQHGVYENTMYTICKKKDFSITASNQSCNIEMAACHASKEDAYYPTAST